MALLVDIVIFGDVTHGMSVAVKLWWSGVKGWTGKEPPMSLGGGEEGERRGWSECQARSSFKCVNRISGWRERADTSRGKVVRRLGINKIQDRMTDRPGGTL